MRDNIMITFANQKGGVGKTTLCTMFADYLAAKGESVLVVDFDRQQTIYSKRNEDVEKYEGVRLPYSVHPFDIKDANNVREFLTNLRNGYKGFVLMDTPGNLSQQGLVPIFALSHYIVCPYQFEATSISSTATFIGFIAKLKRMLPMMKSQFIFVVNKWDKRYGKKAELDLWDKTEERLRHFGLVAPRIEVKADMQRYNTIELMGPQNDIVSPTFDFMYQQIFKPKEQTK
ncbi:ParA family protein [Prevotella intermedia]|uniref:ParA family protein n=1 Tax=Prevotella intermedia TaxID=28131 RepID=A0A3R8CFG2_PREIN|nr:ParA family protein [Prevotella intermedia]RQE01982.1 ParA family protein [Prevotella intermedia]RRF86432.1 ParA family protein [Prevotella intermedia]